MLKKLLTGAAVAAALAAGGPASALTWVSDLEYVDGNAAPSTRGTVTLEELADGNSVKVTVTLNGAYSKFVNTGTDQNSTHDPFLFNLTDTANSTVQINAPVDTFLDGGVGTFNVVGAWDGNSFGDFTNKIKCCNQKNGEKNGDAPPLVFTVKNLGGLTFAGQGAEQTNGVLSKLGGGNRFKSNAGGWWFAADIFYSDTLGGDGKPQGSTFNVVARDARCVGNGCPTTVVPEPNTWALMILGFGAAGAMVRRRKTALA